MSSYQYLYTPTYNSCIRDFQHDAKALVDLHAALAELGRQPFGNPRLQTHHMKGRPGSKRKRFISYVGNRGHRLIWELVNRTIVLLLFGEHDPVERRAERLEFEEDEATGGLRIVEYTRVDEPAPETSAPAVAEEPVGSLFMAWTDEELLRFGFAEHEVPVLRRLDTEDELVALEPRMRPESYRRALNLYLYQRPEGEVAAAQEIAAEERAAYEREIAAAVAEEEKELERQLTAPASRGSFAPVAPDALADVLAKPIEDWMVFLHPDQARLTQRPFSGAARVRGGAGTGKTVVALHRAKHLADTYRGRVLFTTYVRNLPPVFEQLYCRLDQETAGRVEFVNLHKWAYRFLAQQGRPPQLDPGKIAKAYAQAWNSVARPGSYLDERGYSRQYYREEIDWVIKGRDLRTLDDYLSLSRTGRGTPLSEPHRRAVWELYEAYEQELRRQGTQDFNDVLREALASVRDGALTEPYVAVVVDEAQDFTEVGARLVHELAGRDKRDGLFLVGDGQQSVYPGGYSLAAVGIDVVGRSAVLKVNYRNTRQILEAARRVVQGHAYDDLDAEGVGGTGDVVVVRDGEPPTMVGFDDPDEHDTALVAAIDDAARSSGVGPGDLAVLVPTNRLVDHYASAIQALGYRTVKLERYDGRPSDHVKVGTYQRGKGLEFKRVFLPRLDPASTGEQQRFNEDADTYQERLELLRRQLFVAMTRARDALWLGWVGEPSALIERARSQETMR